MGADGGLSGGVDAAPGARDDDANLLELPDDHEKDMARVAAVMYGRDQPAATRDGSGSAFMGSVFLDMANAGVLPDVGVLPAEIRPRTVQAFIWMQAERRKIFMKELEQLRTSWQLRRTNIINKIEAQQKMLLVQLDELYVSCEHREVEVHNLASMLSGVQDQMAKLKAEFEKDVPKNQAALNPAEPEDGKPPPREKTHIDAVADELGLAMEMGLADSPDSAMEKQASNAAKVSEYKSKQMQRERTGFGKVQSQCWGEFNPMKKIVSHPAFEAWSLTVIVLQAIFMGIVAQYEASVVYDPYDYKLRFSDAQATFQNGATYRKIEDWTMDDNLDIGETVFYIWYIVEVILKLIAYRCNFFTNVDWRWNLFDVFCILPWAWIIDAANDTNDDGGGSSGLSFFRVLRLLKLARMLRVVRFMRVFRELRVMMNMMLRSLNTLLWSCILEILIIYVFCMVICLGFTTYLDNNNRSKFVHIHEDSLHKHWGGIWRGMKTLYWSVTFGVDWADIALDMQAMGALYHAIFLIFIMLSVFGVFNVILGVLVVQAHNVVAEDTRSVLVQEQKQSERMLKAAGAVLHRIDVDKTNLLTWDEFETLSSHQDIQDFLNWLDIDMNSAQKLYDALSSGGDGFVDIDQFLEGCTKVKGGANRRSIFQIQQSMGMYMRQMKCLMIHFEENMNRLYPMAVEGGEMHQPAVSLGPRLRIARMS